MCVEAAEDVCCFAFESCAFVDGVVGKCAEAGDQRVAFGLEVFAIEVGVDRRRLAPHEHEDDCAGEEAGGEDDDRAGPVGLAVHDLSPPTRSRTRAT
ncbi:MAG: hypothetical protein DMF56_22920 [Acidobacteria bacterium]|nr:MAG: hypothetical protein DMF56_22920 [Acidobacteriota bacterium]